LEVSERKEVTSAADLVDLSDQDLLALAAHGNRSAFQVLVVRHFPRMHRLAMRLTDSPAEAEEIVQEAFLRLWTNAGRFNPARGRLTTWLHRVTLNLALDRLRAAQPSDQFAANHPDPAPDPLLSLERKQRRAHLASGLAALPSRQRAAVWLIYGEQMGGGEAAAALGITARAVEGLLRRARLFLRARLQPSET
jgi:RNA polymerase sigma-70 factor, ECF subfamily